MSTASPRRLQHQLRTLGASGRVTGGSGCGASGYPDAIFGWAVPSGGDSCDVLLRDAPLLDVRPVLVEERVRLVDRLP